ncbi:hypothetical protein Tco_0747552 [Tanacetum coccineum]|uniref:Uncharacterized protein n=1 Tax=Tanacetum coccineum TaxID=301880 RepID=A0ABQ4YU74_9ASTR
MLSLSLDVPSPWICGNSNEIMASNSNKIPILCDSKSAIAISWPTPVPTSRTNILLSLPFHQGGLERVLIEKRSKVRIRDSATEMELVWNNQQGSNTLSWKPCQGDSSKLNLPDHRIRRRCCSLIPAESRFKTSCSIDKDKLMMKAQVQKKMSSANL